MKIYFIILPAMLLYSPLLAQKSLNFRFFEGFSYQMTISPELPSPWLPPGQIGWQFTRQNQFDRFVLPPGNAAWRIDFEKYLALTFVIPDRYLWQISVSGVKFSPKTAEVMIDWEGGPYGEFLPTDTLTTCLLLIEKHPKMTFIGETNLRFALSHNFPEQILYRSRQSKPEPALLFPPAYTPEDLQTRIDRLKAQKGKPMPRP
ncbi:MAG: hypothetical protein R3C61_01025 [Bacteroidia bacterium]